MGRYVIARAIGDGPYGVVYEARDPKRACQVGLQVVRRGLAPTNDRELRARLLKEFGFLTELSHPNVVGVLEASEVGLDLVIISEHVPGLSVDEWITLKQPPVSEVVAAFAAAGRGLAAAHDQNILHRKLGSSSIWIGDDGKARIRHFRSAALLASTPDAEQEPETDPYCDTELESSEASLTPPELEVGREADPRTDQYAFAALLQRAVFGKRATPAGPREGSAALRQVIGRALRADPSERYASMHALLRDLARDGGRPRWLIAGIVCAAAAGAVVAGLAVVSTKRIEPGICESGTNPVERAWTAEVSDRVGQALLVAGQPAGGVEGLRSRMSQYADSWRAALEKACRAAPRRGDSLACLDRRAFDFVALADALSAEAELSGAAAAGALPAALLLEPVAGCLDSGEAGVRSSSDAGFSPALATSVSAARVVVRLGQADKALAVAKEIENALADDSTSAAAATEALLVVGDAKALAGDGKGAEAAYLDAVTAAALAHSDQATVHAWTRLIRLVARDEGRPGQALAWRDTAGAAMARIQGEPQLEAALAAALGEAHLLRGEPEQALHELDRALTLTDSSAPQLESARRLRLAASALRALDRLTEAEQRAARASDIERELLGAPRPE